MRRTSLLTPPAWPSPRPPRSAGCGVFDQPADLQVYSARHYDVEDAFKEFEEETGQERRVHLRRRRRAARAHQGRGRRQPRRRLHDRRRRQPVERRRPGRPRAGRQPDARRGRARGLPRPRGPLVRPGAAGPHRPLQPRRRRPEPSSTPRTPTPGWPTRSGSGRLCMRDSTEAYTQSLVASLIDALRRATRRCEIVQGWLANDVEIMSNDILLHRGGRRRHLRRGDRQPLLRRARARGATRT